MHFIMTSEAASLFIVMEGVCVCNKDIVGPSVTVTASGHGLGVVRGRSEKEVRKRCYSCGTIWSSAA